MKDEKNDVEIIQNFINEVKTTKPTYAFQIIVKPTNQPTNQPNNKTI